MYGTCWHRLLVQVVTGLLQSYKSDLDNETDEGFWLRYMLGTWLRQVVDELEHT